MEVVTLCGSDRDGSAKHFVLCPRCLVVPQNGLERVPDVVGCGVVQCVMLFSAMSLSVWDL